MPRDYNYDIMPEMKQRYATKNFSPEKIAREELMPLFEAARYAPSAFNEQPWRFIVGDDAATYGKLADTLTPGNAWAREAPVLILVLSTRFFNFTKEPNAHSRYDAGTASGFLQLEALRRGFVCHSMSGFSTEKARKLLEIPPELDIIALIALGRPGDYDALPDEKKALERPGTRNPLPTFLLN